MEPQELSPSHLHAVSRRVFLDAQLVAELS